jgi:hypothetical protein
MQRVEMATSSTVSPISPMEIGNDQHHDANHHHNDIDNNVGTSNNNNNNNNGANKWMKSASIWV